MDDEELLRYSRQIMLPQIGIEGQQKLFESEALIVGLGGLGSPVAIYLATSGIGNLVLADFDEVDLSNLQRQILHTTKDIGLAKTKSARNTLESLNPDVSFQLIEKKLEGNKLKDQVTLADVVIDASDNFSTRFMLNEFCVRTKTPLVSGAVNQMTGQLTVFDSRRDDSPCYRCLYGEDSIDQEEACSETGILAPLAGAIGSLQAAEAIKVLLGIGETLVGKVMLFDAMKMDWRTVKLKKDPTCPVCSG